MSQAQPAASVDVAPRRWWHAAWSPWVLAALVFAATAATAWQISRAQARHLLEQERARVESRLNAFGSALIAEINRRQAVVTGLAAFLRLHGDRPSLPADFELYAAGLHANDPAIRAIQFYPRIGSGLVYPTADNAAVLNRTLEFLRTDDRPAVRADIARTLESRRVTLSQPYELRRGGLGVVARLAVHQGEEFLGMVTVVLNVPPLLEHAGLTRATTDLRIALQDATGAVFFGDRGVPADHPVVYRVPLAEGAWRLAAVPTLGWSTDDQPQLDLLHFSGLLAALLLGGSVYAIARRQTSLASTVRSQNRALNEREQEYRRLFEEAEAARTRITETLERINDGFATLDRDWRYTFVNTKLAETVGRRREDMIGRNIWELFPEAVGTPVHAAYQQAMAEQKALELEHFYLPSRRWFRYQFHPSAAGLTVLSRDITSQKEAERQAVEANTETRRLLAETERSRKVLLSVIEDRKEAEVARRDSEDRYRSLVETSFDWVWEVDTEGRYTYVSPRVRELLGYEPAEVLGRTLFDLMPEDEARRVRAVYQSRAEARQPLVALENVNRHRDGRLVVLETSGVPMFAADGTWLGYRGMDRDITARRADERNLRLRGAALQAAANAIVITDCTGAIEWANPAFTALSGWTLAEAVGKNPRELVKSGEQDREFYRQMWETILAGRIWRGELVNRRKDGVLRTEHMTITPLPDESGKISHFIAIKNDITEQKAMEEHFLQSQRMEAIGTLAGGIAHDLNNILAPIMMVTGLLKDRLQGESDREMLVMLETGARRGAEIVKQLLTFSRGQESERVAVQPRHLVKEMLMMMRETFPRGLDLRQQAGADLWTVTADPTQLHQVLLNLCVNARDAMPEGGRLTIGATNVTLGAGDSDLPPGHPPGPYVLLTVTDTGHGIPPEIRSRIFDPFFTTKPLGKGTGLGLSTVLGIVRSHGGFVSVDSTPGKGSTFKIHLPAMAGSIESTEAPGPAAAPIESGGTVLVVDDERDIRDATRIVLEQQGLRVLTATHGADALAQYREHRAEIRLVLTDLMMPVMNGLALIRALRVINPEVKVIVTSGLAEVGQERELAALGITEILAKPCDGPTLLAALHRRLHTG